MKISICISTYGGARWESLVKERALPSAEAQGADEVIWTHQPNGTIATARNEGAAAAKGDWLIFLDADDELAEGYVAAMRASVEEEVRSRGGLCRTVDEPTPLFTPAVAYCVAGRRQNPKFWPTVPYQDANWMVIGTMISRQWFNLLGGFRNWGDPPGSNAYEDWGLWALAQREGSTVVKVPDAVYVAWVETTSRHRGSTHEERVAWHYEIGSSLFPDRYDEHWLAKFGPRRRAATARHRRRR